VVLDARIWSRFRAPNHPRSDPRRQPPNRAHNNATGLTSAPGWKNRRKVSPYAAESEPISRITDTIGATAPGAHGFVGVYTVHNNDVLRYMLPVWRIPRNRNRPLCQPGAGRWWELPSTARCRPRFRRQHHPCSAPCPGLYRPSGRRIWGHGSPAAGLMSALVVPRIRDTACEPVSWQSQAIAPRRRPRWRGRPARSARARGLVVPSGPCGITLTLSARGSWSVRPPCLQA